MRIVLSFWVLLLTSCNYKTSNQEYGYCTIAKQADIWVIVDDTSGSFLIRGEKIGPIKNSYQNIVSAINRKYVNPSISVEKKEGDTLFVRIDSSEMFTQRMGTTGALNFKAVVVYSLTENDSIKGVFFKFPEGDHGGKPGYFTRKDFKDFTVKECR